MLIFFYLFVCEWVSDCCLMPNENSSAIVMREQVVFDEMMVLSALDNALCWNFILPAHWNNSQQIDMSPHSDTLFWFRANHSVLRLLFNAACLAEKRKYLFHIAIGLNRGLKPRSTAHKPRTLTITTLMMFCYCATWNLYNRLMYGIKKM
jgi:hypothetical protein